MVTFRGTLLGEKMKKLVLTTICLISLLNAQLNSTLKVESVIYKNYSALSLKFENFYNAYRIREIWIEDLGYRSTDFFVIDGKNIMLININKKAVFSVSPKISFSIKGELDKDDKKRGAGLSSNTVAPQNIKYDYESHTRIGDWDFTDTLFKSIEEENRKKEEEKKPINQLKNFFGIN